MANLKLNQKFHGVALVETAIILPLVLLLCMGVIEYGWMFIKASTLNHAARNAARVAIRPDATPGQVRAAVNSVLGTAGMLGYTLTSSPSDLSGVRPGDSITVSLSIPYSRLALTHLPLLPVPQQLYSSVTMAKEGL